MPACRSPGWHLLKVARLLVHLIWGLALAGWIALRDPDAGQVDRLTQRWCQTLLDILRVRVRVEGRPLGSRHLTAANHVSWLDIPVIAALESTRFVAKSEVRSWPLAGWLAAAGGTFFIRRSRGGSGPVLDQLVPHLSHAGSVVLFPEGTTTDGSEVLPFHSRLFEAALAARCPVQPVTLRYELSSSGESVAPFIGEDALIPHLWRLLQEPGLEVCVRYGPPIQPEGRRQEIAQEAESFVRSALGPPPRAALHASAGAAVPRPA